MLKQLFIIVSVLNILIYANPAANNADAESETHTVEEDVKLNLEPYGVAENSYPESLQGQRQKRFDDYTDLSGGLPLFDSFSSFLPLMGPKINNFNKEQYQVFEITKRLRNIAELTRRQYLPPPPPPIQTKTTILPIVLPYFLMEQCGCNNQAYKPGNKPSTIPQTTASPSIDTSPTDKEGNGNDKNLGSTTPDFSNRINTDGNTGSTINNNVSDSNDDEDGVRPISFDPITPKVPPSVTAPPVEHGSFQAGAETNGIPETADRVQPNTENFPSSLAPGHDARLPPSVPSVCDKAILYCCHKPPKELTYNCFENEGCTNINYNDPCNSDNLQKIVNKIYSFIKTT